VPAHPPRQSLPSAADLRLLPKARVVRTRSTRPLPATQQDCPEPGHGPFVRCRPAPVLHLPRPSLAGALLAAVDGTLAVAALLDGGRCRLPVREPEDPPARVS
jgi:hypothetical protein